MPRLPSRLRLASLCVALSLLVACATHAALRPAPSSPSPSISAPAASIALGDLVAARPAAARVLLEHRIDFCCGGRGTLAEAAAARGLDPAKVLAEIDAAERRPLYQDEARWLGRPSSELIEHVVARYHADLRADLPRLLDLSRRVDRAHALRDDRPRGLTAHLETMAREILAHLEVEEQQVFPAILEGRARREDPGVAGLVRDHEALGHALARTRELSASFVAPPDACPTWRALYAGLDELERRLMLHAHLENNVLFPALPGAAAREG